MTELEKCKIDFIYWLEHYCIIKHKRKEIPIKLKDYQQILLKIIMIKNRK